MQVPLPDCEARLEFFRLVLQRPELAVAHDVGDGDLARLVHVTRGCRLTGADLQHISREAAMRPVREGLAQCGACNGGIQTDAVPTIRKLVLSDFMEALKCVQPSGSMFDIEE